MKHHRSFIHKLYLPLRVSAALRHPDNLTASYSAGGGGQCCYIVILPKEAPRVGDIQKGPRLGGQWAVGDKISAALLLLPFQDHLVGFPRF